MRSDCLYSLALSRTFTARHFLVGGDWGPENLPHPHQYCLEVRVSGPELDAHGYLVDLVDMEKRMEEIVTSFQDRLLNDLPPFQGINPSIEHLARIIAKEFQLGSAGTHLTAIRVKIWENDLAWASYSEAFR
jgi:6-pyruvoyltetrahydropterin/6-carboxytetrahydropterin synthase